MAKNSIGQSCGGCLVLIVGVAFAMPYIKGCVDSGFEAVERQQEQAAIAEKQLDVEKPKGTEERLRHDIAEALGTSNRNRERATIDVAGGRITVLVAFNDNLTEGMIQSGMQIDIADTLKAVSQSGYNFSDIIIRGTFPLVDKFGNSRETEVLQAEYSKSTVSRINWNNFLFDNVFDIADSIHIDPAVK